MKKYEDMTKEELIRLVKRLSSGQNIREAVWEGKEEKLHESEIKCKIILDNIGDALFIIDQGTGNILDVSRSATGMYGFSREELINMNIKDISAESEETARNIESPEAFTPLQYHYRSDGSIFPVDLTLNMFEMDGKNTVIVTAREVNTRMKAEKVLEESKNRWKFALEGTGDGMWDWNVETNRVYFSHLWKAMLGYDDNEIGNTLDEWDKRVHPEDKTAVYSDIERHFRGETDIYSNEHRILCKDGSYKWVLDRGKVIKWSENKKPLHVIGTHKDITERKKSEEMLYLFKNLVENSSDAIAIATSDGKHYYQNKSFIDLFGSLKKGNDPIQSLYADRVTGKEVFTTIMAGRSWHGEIKMFRKDRTISDVFLRAYAIKNYNGSIIGLVGIHTDITYLKKVEEELKEKEKYCLLFDSAGDSILIHDIHGLFLSVNATACMEYGYSFEEFTSLNVKNIDTLEQSIYADERIAELMQKGSLNFETVHKRKDNSSLYVEVNARKILFHGRDAMMSICRNITKRKEMEDQLCRAKEITELAQKAVRAGIWYWDIEKGYVEWSEEMFNILGLKSSENKASFDTWHSVLYNEDRKEAEHLLRESVNNRTMLDSTYRITLPDGEKRWINTLGKTICNETGQSVRMTGFCIDITEKKAEEEEKKRLQAQFMHAQKMEAVGRLAGGVAHDFNNMLAIILGFVELIEDKLYPSDPICADIEQIHKAIERSADLTKQLLAFARKQITSPRLIELNKTVKGMINMVQRIIGEDIHMDWKPSEKLLFLKIDPVQIDQILANLLVNARDAIDGIGKVTIETDNAVFNEDYCALHTGFLPGNYIMLAVSDNGCGIDRETVAHIFEPFFTTKEAGKGTGLGLATVYGIVKQNKGFINVYSEPGTGTTFKIYLPFYEDDTVSEELQKQKKSEKTGVETVLLVEDEPVLRRGSIYFSPISPGETVLLVEDEPVLLELSEAMLENMGYTVIKACTPSEALSAARNYKGNIELVITDVIMPGMNGRELVEELNTIYPDIKHIFMSGYTANIIAHHGVLDKGVHFIQKPFSKKELSYRLREVMES